MNRQILVALVAISGALAVDAAVASSWDEPPHAVVRIADLDLKSAAGVATLRSRIESAARRVCAPLDGRTLQQKRARTACIARATDEALAAVIERAPQEQAEFVARFAREPEAPALR